MKPECPHCGHPDHKLLVTESDAWQIRRIYQCEKCYRSYSEYESKAMGNIRYE